MHRIAALFIVGTCWVIYSLLLAGAAVVAGRGVLRSAQSACSREKATLPSWKRNSPRSSSWTKAGSPQPTFRNSISMS
jgi:hypothetical protein